MKIKKSILIWIAFMGFAALLNAQTTQQVTAIQYYYDTDPGVGNTGNGAIVSVTPTANLDQVFSLNVPATLVNGFHYLYVRAQDENGSWSLAERRLFVIQSITATDNITDYAYYFDTDPGVGNPGNGAIVPVTPTANFSSTVAITVPPSLSEGFHYLYIRTKDASGQWSITERRLFVIQSITATENITDYAYYFDTDPGVGNPGNGAIVPVTPTANFSATVAITVPASLTEGFHYLYMRTRDESGQWSLSERRLFVTQAITAAEDIIALEWYIDNDPGVGNGTAYPLTTAGDINATIDLGGVPCSIPAGTHYLYVRAKNTAGRWSIIERLALVLVAPEISVLGNTQIIADGDVTPDVADDTDFGQPLPSVQVTKTYTIENNGSAPLTISSLLMNGNDASSFTIGGITTPLTIAMAGSTTFTVSFAAAVAGNYDAVVNINSDDCGEALYDFAIQGEVICVPPTITNSGAQAANSSANCDAVVSYTTSSTGTVPVAITYAFAGATLGSGNGDGSGSVFSKGITTVTLTATNACGTVSTSFDVVVTDITPPTVNCPGPVTLNNDPGTCTSTLADYTSQVTYSDNCPFSTGFAKVSAGAAHTLALGPDGSLWAWGWNVYGEFGNGTTSPYTSNGGSAIPIKIGTDTDWVTIEAGANASYAIKSDGTLWAWGGNSTGQLGDGSIIDKLTPVQIGTATNWVSIASSYRSTSDVHTIGLQSNGTLWAWGANNTGQLGTGNNIYVTTPTQVGTSTDWASFDIGQFFSLAIKTNGTMWSWGSNYSFTLGTGTRFQNENSPVQIGTDNDWMRVEAGGDHGLAMKSDGTIWTWGSNQIGALAGVIGQSVGAAQRDPLQIGSETDWTSISAGSGFSLALKSNGELWSSGWSQYNQRGPGATISNALEQVGSATDWATIETGNDHSTVFKTDGTLWAWGWNVKGQLGTGAPTSTIGYINPALVVAPVFSAVVQSPAPGTLIPLGANTITFSVTDVSGNKDSCTQIVTVVDMEAPQISCAPSDTINNTPGLCTGTTTLTAPVATDNCTSISNALDFDGVNDYVSIPHAPMLAIGSNPVSVECWFTAPNVNQIGFLITKRQPVGPYNQMGIIINDGSSPFSPGAGKKLTFSIFASTSHYRQITTVNDIVDGAEHHVAAVSDPVTGTLKLYVDGVLQAVNTGSVGAGFPTIGNTMPYEIGSGNTNVWLYKGQVDEVRIWNTARTQAEIQANMNIELNTSTGLVASYHLNEGVADGNNAGITTATDASGNGNDGTLNNFALNGSVSNWVAGNVAGGPTVTNDAPAIFPVGNTTVTWIATDASNNTDSCTQVITVLDNEAPVVTCPADITGVIATSAAGAIVNYTAPTGSDNCPGVTTVLLSGLVDGATFPIGTTSVWYEVTDASGNKDSCSFNVTVVGVAPQISCPANIVQNNTPGSCNAIVNFSATETAGIPASVITYSIASGSVFNVGTVTVTATATNAVGFSSCTFDVTVNDDEMPITPVLADVIGECSATATASTTTDNCAGIITGTTSDPLSYSTQGTHVIQWTFDDGNGNPITVNQNVIVDDVTPPATPVLADVTGECSATATASTTTDNCAGIITGTTSDPLSYSTQGTHVIQWTFDDGNGNPITVNQNVIVDDVTPPATPVLADVTGECSATATASTTTDNCAGIITGTTSDPLSYSTQGTHVIQWTFDDGNGNPITVNQNVIVDDVTPPATPVLADVTGECSATATASTTTDNCAGTITGTTTDPLSYSTQGTHIIQWTFDDGNGNPVTVNQNVIVDDVTPPTVVTKNISVTLSSGTASIAAADVEDGSTDNCGVDFNLSTVSPSTFGCADLGTNTVTLTVFDVNGNSNTQTATVNVIGEIPSCSIVSIPNSSVFTGGNPNALYLGYGAQSTTLSATSTGGSVWTYSWSGNTSLLSNSNSANPVFTPTAAGSYTYTVTSTNEFGCSSTCDVTIDVMDVNCSNNVNNHKVLICHNGKTICISINATATHLSSYPNDYLGPCSSSNKSNSNGAGGLNVMAYPSPYNSTFNVDIVSGSDSPVDITLHGMDGKILEVYENVIPSDAPPMGAGLAGGMYILSVTQNGTVKRIKVTKE